jgi:polyisoprenoid-binding protein YceI
MQPGTYALGPQTGTLTARTGRRGAIARAGHDLLIEVGEWSATVALADDPSQSELRLTVDSSSLRVIEGTGGLQALDDDDRSGISQTIDEEVLERTSIVFRSTSVSARDGGTLHVDGELELAGATRPIGFDLTLSDDGHVAGSAVVTQSAWGMKPYTALFGTLKVADDVEVSIDGTLSAG